MDKKLYHYIKNSFQNYIQIISSNIVGEAGIFSHFIKLS